MYLQDACWKHRYIRSKHTSLVPERPERLRAVILGLSAAIARLDPGFTSSQVSEADALAATLERTLNIGQGPESAGSSSRSSSSSLPTSPICVKSSNAVADFFNNAAVKFVHGDVDGDVYLEKLRALVHGSAAKIANGESEIPEGLSQGDLYLSPGSLDAMQGAIGTLNEAIDGVVAGTASPRAFVAIRPPGHHCGEDTPSGFCFINNVAVGAAHAHLKHKIKRAIIFDIDLHHGNGTQSIAWQINEETFRKKLEQEAGAPPEDPGLQVFYGSIHDILSYPCEEGKPDLVQAASTSIHGPHGQYIENIHLERYESNEQFFAEVYPKYLRLISRAETFLGETGGADDDVMVFISCGMDACEHEHDYMSRHGRKVPVSFYHRFTRDACAFADKFARGRLISVLEGGYSDRALISSTMAHTVAMAQASEDESWWSLDNLTQLEKLLPKKRKSPRPSAPTTSPSPWLSTTSAIYTSIEALSPNMIAPPPSTPRIPTPVLPSSRTLRERKPKSGVTSAESTPSSSPLRVPRSTTNATKKSPIRKTAPTVTEKKINILDDGTGSDSSGSSELSSSPPSPVLQVQKPLPQEPAKEVKKLPRVILHVRPPPGMQGASGAS